MGNPSLYNKGCSKMIDSNMKLEIKFLSLRSLKLWEGNPKKHDIGAIIQSIERYGFLDPPKYDSSLDAIIEGNGRVEALRTLKASNTTKKVPNGIAIDSHGEWYIPVLVGNDLPSTKMALGYAVDHNNISYMGGDGITSLDISRMYDMEDYLDVLSQTSTVSVDEDDMELLMGISDKTLSRGRKKKVGNVITIKCYSDEYLNNAIDHIQDTLIYSVEDLYE
jgi:hypothetical protein